VPKLTRRRIEKHIRRLISDIDSNSAEDWLELYFTQHAGENHALLEYYRHRFVLPRTLAAYSLIELMPANTTILDIACGLGPFGHFLSNRPAASSVIGFDFNFYLAWWQRRFMAPSQLFVCADAGQKLPFQDGAFDGVYCSDSFMYIPNQEQLLNECRRCAPNRPLVIARVGNGDAYPKRWGDELNAEGYLDLFGEGTQVFREIDLVRCYLNRRNPLQQDLDPVSELGYDKWFYVITNVDTTMREFTPGLPAPHATGRATLNPIFSKTGLGDGRVRFDFEFPSVWFAYQNADMFAYHGDRTESDVEVVNSIGDNIDEPALADLVDKFVVIGLPPKYLRQSKH
jgi:SAM-dependent methyltransferase